MAPRRRSLSTVGWREWIELPDYATPPMKAKIDTGARTSALHAFGLSVEEIDGQPWASFEIHPVQRSARSPIAVSCPVTGYRTVRSSTGHAERRPVISSTVALGSKRFTAEITLTSRDEMGFRMLLGRAALRRRFVVDPGRSFLLGPPTDGDGPT